MTYSSFTRSYRKEYIIVRLSIARKGCLKRFLTGVFSVKKNIIVHFEQINVNGMTNAAGIFIGTNLQTGWSSHGKSNSGFGTIMGKRNLVNQNMNIVDDRDLLDTPIDDRDRFTTAQKKPI